MTNLEITVHVNLGVTPELTALVNAILHKETQPVVAASSEPAPEAAPAPVEEKPACKPRKAKEEPTESEAPTEESPAHQDDAPKELTEKDVLRSPSINLSREIGHNLLQFTNGNTGA